MWLAPQLWKMVHKHSARLMVGVVRLENCHGPRLVFFLSGPLCRTHQSQPTQLVRPYQGALHLRTTFTNMVKSREVPPSASTCRLQLRACGYTHRYTPKAPICRPEIIPARDPKQCVCVCVNPCFEGNSSIYLSIYLFLTAFFHLVQKQGVVARQRVYHQRRRSLSLGDTGTDHPSVPATF